MRSLVPILAAAILATPALAAEPQTVVTKGQFRIEFAGTYQTQYANYDTIVESWMTANKINAAQLAFRKNGVLLFSHAYTMGASTPLVSTTNVMRLASNSKMTVTAAATLLLAEGKIKADTKVFPFLGITKPLFTTQHPDSRINDITVMELINHQGGFHGEGSGDPLFEMRDIEVQLKHEPLTKAQFAEYLYGQPLLFAPGSSTLYSNVGYFLFGMVVEKASGQSFINYVNTALMAPLGIKNVSLSATHYAQRNPNEVPPLSPYSGPSVFDLSANPVQAPFNYEGGDIIWEVADAPSDLVTNAESLSLFIHTWDVYGTGYRNYDYARDGCMPGSSTWAESLGNNVDVAMFFNSQPCLDFSSSVIVSLDAALNKL